VREGGSRDRLEGLAAVRTVHPPPTTRHPSHHTLHPTPYTLPYTLHPTPYTLHPTPYTHVISLKVLRPSAKLPGLMRTLSNTSHTCKVDTDR